MLAAVRVGRFLIRILAFGMILHPLRKQFGFDMLLWAALVAHWPKNIVCGFVAQVSWKDVFYGCLLALALASGSWCFMDAFWLRFGSMAFDG